MVSTIWTFLSYSSFISCTAAPKAGRMTTSPWATPEKSFPAEVSSMKLTCISRSLCTKGRQGAGHGSALGRAPSAAKTGRAGGGPQPLLVPPALLTWGLWMISLVIQMRLSG